MVHTTYNTASTPIIMDDMTQGNAFVQYFGGAIYFKVSMLAKPFQGSTYPDEF